MDGRRLTPNYKKNYPDRETMGKLTFSELETHELGSEALLELGNWHLERARIEDKWVIVHDHSSALSL